MTAATPSNSVDSVYLKHLTDDQIREQVAKVGPEMIERAFPGKRITSESLDAGLVEAGADFAVRLDPMQIVHPLDMSSLDAPLTTPVEKFAAVVRVDNLKQLGVVGETFGLVQTRDHLEAAHLLIENGHGKLTNVEVIGAGERVRVVMLIGTSTFNQIDGSPNTLAHFAIFEATHNGNASSSVRIFTLRLECLNGMTSLSVVKVYKLAHRSRAAERLDDYTESVLVDLIGDAQAEVAIFAGMAAKAMRADEFEKLSNDWLGPIGARPTTRKTNRRAKEIEELLGYFEGGNEGAGATEYGAFMSHTRFLEAKRERLTEYQKNAARFDSNLQGDGQRMLKRSLDLCRRIVR